MRRVVALSLSLMIVVAACGDDDVLSESDQALADAISQAILDENDDPASPLGPVEAECIAENSVRQIGVEGLGEIGITPENPSPEDAFERATDEQVDAILDVFFECIDFAEALIQGFEEELDLSSESVECLAEEFQDRDLLRAIMRASVIGEEFEFGEDRELSARLIELVIGCVSVEELVDLGG